VSTRVSRPASLTLIVPLVALLVAACGAAASPTPSPTPIPPTPSPSPAPAIVLLKVTAEGGFIGPTASLAALPTVVVYADGRIFLPAVAPAIYPGSLLQGVTVRDVGAAGVAAILVAIRAAGLDKPGAGDGGVTADTGATVFAVVIDGKTTTSRFARLGGGPGMPGGGNPGSAAALDLLDRLTDPTDTWGSGSAPETTFVPTAFRIFVVPGAPPVDPTVTQAPLEWPLATTLDAFGVPANPDRGITGLRVGIVRGAGAAALAPFLAKATVLTPVTSAGESYTLYVRGLLPDESGD